ALSRSALAPPRPPATALRPRRPAPPVPLALSVAAAARADRRRPAPPARTPPAPRNAQPALHGEIKTGPCIESSVNYTVHEVVFYAFPVTNE
ncbi:Protein of unknown function, partial [Gryllus bimaculatus]